MHSARRLVRERSLLRVGLSERLLGAALLAAVVWAAIGWTIL